MPKSSLNLSRIFFLFAVIVWFHSSDVNAIHCYSGRNLTENGMGGAVLGPCGNDANGCFTADNPQTHMTLRGCVIGNCTDEHYRYSPDPICVNGSQPPNILSCCCYGDGCNGNQEERKYKLVQEEPFPVDGLKCYQGQTLMDQPLNSPGGAQLLPCRGNANACVKHVNLNSRVTLRQCKVGNCTDEEVQQSSEQICKNMSVPPYAEQCHIEQCCYGDGCNGNEDESKYRLEEIKCYQGRTSIDQPVDSPGGAQLLPCRSGSNACRKHIDFNSRVIVRQCKIGDCTDELERQYLSEPICENMTVAQQCSSTLCCQGDGCNI
ncbi:hypothetical protein DdX_17360 [Ditylenchus destructor]|uniref:Uncharacterized protein n=1 Tax=Ditylenchus destructor TaxID=166010 RepID=A0AAD4MMB1_9BILA|nr:hypothetical protein DdX_17360 [Ditylenchus destructor]